MQAIRVNHAISIGGQPSPRDLAAFSQRGFRSVVNLRRTREEADQLDPVEEEELVHRLEMEYLHFPSSIESLDAASVDRFRARLTNLPKPALVHCATGKRAAALVLIDMACRQGLTGREAIAMGSDLGFPLDNDQLQSLVVNYVDQRSSAVS